MEFLELAAPLTDQMELLEQSLRKYSSPIRGTLRIGLIWSFAYLRINELLNAFSRLYPDIALTFMIDGSVSLLERFKAHELDLLFVNLPDHREKDSFDSYLISANPLCAILHESHPLARNKTILASDLRGENILLPDGNTSIGRDILALLKDVSPELNVIGKSSQVDVCMQIAASNLGISFASQEAAEASCYKELPVLTVPLEPQITRRTYMVYRKKERRNPLENTFISYMIKIYEMA